MLTLADTIEALTGIRPTQASQEIARIVNVPGQAFSGTLFVDLSGNAGETASSVSEAFQNGACLAIVDIDLPGDFQVFSTADIGQAEVEAIADQAQPFCLRVENSRTALLQLALYWRRRHHVRMVGITGSVGKTTTKNLAVEVLSTRYRTLKNSGKPTSEVEVPLALLTLNGGDERIVIEVGMKSLADNPLLYELASPHVAVMTNMSAAHLADAEMSSAVQALRNWLLSLSRDRVAILNYDDLWERELAADMRANRFFYGLDPKADLWADQVEGLGLEGISFRLHYRGETVNLRVPLIGRHSVHTALRAAAVGLVEGLLWDDILRGLQFGETQLQLSISQTATGALILDDTYNASPDSMLAALNLLSEMEGRRIAVLAGMRNLGAYERQAHEMVGLRASQVVDHLVVVGELGRYIAVAARTAWLPSAAITEVANYQEAVQFLRSFLDKDDVVLVKGSHMFQMEKIAELLEVV